MRQGQILLVFFSAALVSGCLSINKTPLLLNLRENESHFNLTDNGGVAISPQVETAPGGLGDGELVLQLVNDKDEYFDISLRPDLENHLNFDINGVPLYSKALQKEKFDFPWLLYQLPPGKYRTKNLAVYFKPNYAAMGPHSMGAGSGQILTKELQEEVLEVKPGQILHLGSFLFRWKSDGWFNIVIESQRLGARDKSADAAQGLESDETFEILDVPLQLALVKKGK